MWGMCLPSGQTARWIVSLSIALACFACLPSLAQTAQNPSITPITEKTPAAIEPTAKPKPGSISGTVTDQDGAVITNAKIKLSAQSSTAQEISSGSDGRFVFTGVTPGPFELTVASQGFATQKRSGILQPGQDYIIVPEIELMAATEVEVVVREDSVEVAREQIHVEETQRVLGVVPNFFVSYVPNPAPLNTKQKFQLSWKLTIDPVSIGIAAAIAGVEQANNSFSGYRQGTQGYAKRFGASYADMVSGTFIGNAILPAVFKQDPRYFYKGTGSRKSRLFYALGSAFICKGDNKRWQPNYSNMLGALAAGGISNLYYPAASRNGVGLTFENAFIAIGGGSLGAVAQEFFLRHITPHASEAQPGY